MITGPSGCGKSTLLKCINGIYPFVNGGTLKGDIAFDGNSIMDVPPELRSAYMGTVFQDFDSQIIHLSVEDELAFGPENMAMARADIAKRVDETASLIQLPLDADPNVLSGGNKQRLCLGGVLAMRPKLLLLDEPFSNVDKEGASRLARFLLELKKRGHSIIIVEHRLELVIPYADKVVWMSGGRLSDHIQPLAPLEVDSTFPSSCAGPAVRVRGLSFGYEKNRNVLSCVRADVTEGDMAVIVGLNGSGKSTFLKILAGLLPFKKGEVELCGVPAKGKPARFFRERVGLVMQNPNHQLFMDSVHNEIYYNCMDERLTNELLRTFGLYTLRDRHPYSLSEGEKRRTALAAVLAARPRILLLDEPTLGQDRESLRAMITSLRAYNRKERLTVLTVTHEEAAARALGDRVLLFDGGSIVQVPGGISLDKFFTINLPLNNQIRPYNKTPA